MLSLFVESDFVFEELHIDLHHLKSIFVKPTQLEEVYGLTQYSRYIYESINMSQYVRLKSPQGC